MKPVKTIVNMVHIYRLNVDEPNADPIDFRPWSDVFHTFDPTKI